MPTTILTPGSSPPPIPLPADCRFLPFTGPIGPALDRVPNGHLLLLDPLDTLNIPALPALIQAASQPGVSGAIGRFVFTSPIGDLPRPVGVEDPFTTLPSTLTLPHLLSLRPIPSAVLINRSALADLRPRTDLSTGAEFDLILRLAQSAPFAYSPELIVRRHLAPLAEIDATLSDLAAHIRILAEFIPLHDLPTAASDLIDALIVLRAHQRTIAGCAATPTLLAAATRFPSLFSQWWHRCGFFGPAPRHILSANGGVAEAVSTDPALIAKRILSLCPRQSPPILLGLGRNARAVANALHAAGIPVIGRDDSAPPLPAWAAQDNIPIQLLPADHPFSPAATHIMTVLHDDAFLARLPRAGQDLRLIRWRDMPGLILAEWRSAALDWALRTSSPITEPKPALAKAAT